MANTASVRVQYVRIVCIYIEVAHLLPKAKLEVKACNILIVNNLGFKIPLYKYNHIRLLYNNISTEYISFNGIIYLYTGIVYHNNKRIERITEDITYIITENAYI